MSPAEWLAARTGAADAWTLLAFCVFVTHLPFFAWRWWRTREARFLATSVTFLLLTVTYGLRLAVPDLRVAGVPLHIAFRVVAWSAAALSLTLLCKHFWHVRQRLKNP